MSETLGTTKEGDFLVVRKIVETRTLEPMRFGERVHDYLTRSAIHNGVVEMLDKHRHAPTYDVCIVLGHKSLILEVAQDKVTMNGPTPIYQVWDHGAFPLVYHKIAYKVVWALTDGK